MNTIESLAKSQWLGKILKRLSFHVEAGEFNQKIVHIGFTTNGGDPMMYFRLENGEEVEVYTNEEVFVEEETIDKCQGCGKLVDGKLHSCPFSEEIYNDSSESCNCCEECSYQCQMDI